MIKNIILIVILLISTNTFSQSKESKVKYDIGADLLEGTLSNKKEITPEEIIKKLDTLYRGKSSYSLIEMKIQTSYFKRTLKMKVWSKGEEKTLVKIVRPKKDKGIATLKRNKDIHNFFPKINKVMKVPSSMMMGSWMGSHLTNDDLVKEARLEEDYTATISFEGWRDGQNIIEFTLIPKEDAAVVWGKLELIILADSHIPVVEYYYDEDMALARTIRFSDVQQLGGRQRPAALTVIPADKKDEYTQFIYQSLSFDIELKDNLFSLSSLKSR